MARPKLQVNEVWILQEVMPYEGNEILGVFFDPKVAMDGRGDKGRWQKVTDDGETWWSTRHGDSYESFYLLTQHTVRTK